MTEALWGVVVGGVLGFVSAYGLELLREQRQSKADRESLAAALAAELRAWLSRWSELGLALNDFGETAWSWVGEESYFSVFDGAGHRLHLLPPEVLSETVILYAKMKEVYDTVRQVGELIPYLHSAVQDGEPFNPRDIGHNVRLTAIEKGKKVAGVLPVLAEKLEALAKRQS